MFSSIVRKAGIFVVIMFLLSVVAQTNDPKQDKKPPRSDEIGHIGIDKPALPPPKLLNVEGLREGMKELGISDATAEKIVTITRNFNVELEKKILHVQREEITVKELLINKNPDMNAIEPVIKRKALLIADIEVEQIKRDIAIRSLLTVDEFEKWKLHFGKRPESKDRPKQQGDKRPQ